MKEPNFPQLRDLAMHDVPAVDAVFQVAVLERRENHQYRLRVGFLILFIIAAAVLGVFYFEPLVRWISAEAENLLLASLLAGPLFTAAAVFRLTGLTQIRRP